MTLMLSESSRVRVLIVDDSAMIRKVLSLGLATDPLIEVVGAASSADQAFEMIRDLRPDVMTLDVEMPRMDGVSFLRKLMPETPLPTIIISSTTTRGASITLQALEAGAVDVIAKPTIGVGGGLNAIMADICQSVRSAARARPSATHRPMAPHREISAPPSARPALIAIGASTGGVQALTQVLQEISPLAPGIVIVQHMPEGFTGAFAKRLDSICGVEIREAVDGDQVCPGVALIAPGGTKHLTVVGRAPHWHIAMVEGGPVCFSRPSVDVMFKSVARAAGPQATAALLTGMGRDGAEGLLAIRRAGGTTIAQDEATSIVWGMPAAAVELGAAQSVLPLEAIPHALMASSVHAGAAAQAALFSKQGTAR